MGILEGLEKFGLDGSGLDNLFGEAPKEEVEQEVKEEVKEKAPTPEEEYLLVKKVTCGVCDRTFKEKAVKSSKMYRMTPDKDLRPRFQGVDTIKYDVTSCPYCGYTAMNRYFDHLSTLQRKLIREGICTKFTSSPEDDKLTYSYDTAIDRYKLSLFNTVVKMGTTSEKAYTCLKISWLYRGKAEELASLGLTMSSDSMKQAKIEERKYYQQAYEGFTKAISSEAFPICGMDQNTIDLLLANMAFNLEEYETASRLVSRLLISKTANRNAKDRAYDLKEEIVNRLKGN